jgi:rare lipoprotein A
MALLLLASLLVIGCVSRSAAQPTEPEPAKPEWQRAATPDYPLVSGAPEPPPDVAAGAPNGSSRPPQQQAASASPLAQQYAQTSALQSFTGKATYYSESLAGRSTASGEPYAPAAFTAAHRKLPFGSGVRVVRTDTGHATYVRINDRGPFAGKDRIIDLSTAAAKELEMMRAGVVDVRVEVLRRPKR